MAKKVTQKERGYGYRHKVERKKWKRIVAAGNAYCVRCNGPIWPDEPFDVDHDDWDRSRYLGVSHPSCNRATEKHGIKALRRRVRRRFSRRW